MNKNQVKGHTNEAKGKVKEVAGKITGDKSMEYKGKAEMVVSQGDCLQDLGRGWWFSAAPVQGHLWRKYPLLQSGADQISNVEVGGSHCSARRRSVPFPLVGQCPAGVAAGFKSKENTHVVLPSQRSQGIELAVAPGATGKSLGAGNGLGEYHRVTLPPFVLQPRGEAQVPLRQG